MKAKVVTVILSVAVVVSIVCNVNQYNEGKQLELAIAESNDACAAQELHNSELESQIADAQARLESVKNEVSALSEHIETATAERDALQSELSDLQAKAEQKKKEEEEAARKAAEKVETAKNTTTSKASTTTTTVADGGVEHEMTQAEIDAAWANFASQFPDAQGVVYLSDEERATSAGGGDLSWCRCE